jgi:hypothetical protein
MNIRQKTYSQFLRKNRHEKWYIGVQVKIKVFLTFSIAVAEGSHSTHVCFAATGKGAVTFEY